VKIHFYLIASLLVGCNYDKPPKTTPMKGEAVSVDSLSVFDDRKVVHEKVGNTEYYGYANAEKNKKPWTGYPYFFQPIDKEYGVLELKELSLPGGSQIGNLTVVQLPLKQGQYHEEDVLGNQFYYVVLGNDCSPKGFYQIEDSVGWHSNIEIIKFDSLKRELKARFNMRFRLNEADAKRYPELPRNIVFKNGIVQAIDIRHNKPR
jgi:hypothetical protein